PSRRPAAHPPQHSTLSLHDALPISGRLGYQPMRLGTRHGVDLRRPFGQVTLGPALAAILTGEHLATSGGTVHTLGLALVEGDGEDRKSTRLNSSHVKISYAVFCLKK